MFKFKSRLFRFFRIVVKDTWTPFYNAPASLLPIPAVLFIAFFFDGHKGIQDEFFILMKAALAFILTMPLWFILCFIMAPFKVLAEEQNEGVWEDFRFIYNSPKQIATCLIKPQDNLQNSRIKIPEVPGQTLAHFKVEYEGGMGCLVLKNHESSGVLPSVNSRNIRYGIRLSKKSEIVIQKLIQPDSDCTVAKLSLIYWEK